MVVVGVDSGEFRCCYWECVGVLACVLVYLLVCLVCHATATTMNLDRSRLWFGGGGGFSRFKSQASLVGDDLVGHAGNGNGTLETTNLPTLFLCRYL